MGTLCDEIDEQSLDALFIGYISNEGMRVKAFICDAAKRKM